MGVNLLDTADCYGCGLTPEQIAEIETIKRADKNSAANE